MIDSVAISIGGPPHYACEAVAALRTEGFLAELASLDGTSCAVPETNRRAAVGWRRVIRAVRGSDVIHLHGFFSGLALGVALLCALWRRPFVISTHGQLARWSLAQSPWRKRLFLFFAGRWILRRAAAVVALSPDESAPLDRWLPCRAQFLAEPSVSVPHVARARPERVAGASLRVLFLGRLHVVKRVELVIGGVARARQRGVNLWLDIAGDGDPATVRFLKNEVAWQGLGDIVKFHGLVHGREKAELLRNSDVLVLPSRHENFAIAAAEALVCGVPVVLSSEVAISGDAARAGAGYRLSPTTATAIGEALAELADESFRRRMAHAALRFAAGQYSRRRFAFALMDAYQHALRPAEVEITTP